MSGTDSSEHQLRVGLLVLGLSEGVSNAVSDSSGTCFYSLAKIELSGGQNIEQVWVTVQCTVWSQTLVRTQSARVGWASRILGWRTCTCIWCGQSAGWMQHPWHPLSTSLLARQRWRQSFWNIPTLQAWVGFTGHWCLVCPLRGQARLLGAKAGDRRDWRQSVFLQSQGKLCVSNRCCGPCHEQEINSDLPAPSWTWNQPSFLLLW